MRVQKKVYSLLYIAILVFLSIPALKLVAGVRIGQFFVLITFMLLLAEDISNRELQGKILLYFLIGTIVMSLISFNSIQPKFGEMKFVIKYLLIFSAAYYVGARAVQKLTIENLIIVMEIVAFIYCLNAFIINFVPLPQAIFDQIISYRIGWGGTRYIDYQGTFFEAGWLAMGVGSVAIVSFLMRNELQLWPKNRAIFYMLYGFIIMTLGLSRNKTIWIALIIILLLFVFYKIYLNLRYSSRYKPVHMDHDNEVLKLLSKIDVVKVLLGILFFIILFFIINSSLSEPIVSAEMIQEKLEKERGKVFLIIIDLLKESYFFGGYGFGFIEAYFTLIPQDILGLGEGSAMIFNSYLDIWISASIFGLIFHLGLIYMSTDNRYFITMVIPFFYVIFANFNPAIADETYYFFLGLSLSIATALTHRREEKCLQK